MLLGDPQTAKSTPTQTFSILMLLAGNVIFALVFSEVLIALTNLTRIHDDFARQMGEINNTMKMEAIPPFLQRRVRRFATCCCRRYSRRTNAKFRSGAGGFDPRLRYQHLWRRAVTP